MYLCRGRIAGNAFVDKGIRWYGEMPAELGVGRWPLAASGS